MYDSVWLGYPIRLNKLSHPNAGAADFDKYNPESSSPNYVLGSAEEMLAQGLDLFYLVLVIYSEMLLSSGKMAHRVAWSG